LRDGYVTESLDGRQVAPLMGKFEHADVGTARITTFPNFWCHANCDYAMTTRLFPLDAQTTAVHVAWLVERDALEGIDYALDVLLPFWQRTSEQDWALCEGQQAGVRSAAYVPGPYSPRLETNVNQFVLWYLAQVRSWLEPRSPGPDSGSHGQAGENLFH
jgi:Rieske 2Fe-2S family protein